MKPHLFCILLTILYVQVAYSQNTCTICDSLENNVVKIHTTFDDGSDENGFGFVIAERSDKLFIVTAKHVIYELDGNRLISLDKKTKSVSVKFFSDQGRDFPATWLNPTNTDLDITLLEVNKPGNYSWEKDFYATNAERGTAVWFIGKAADWFVPINPGAINEISANDEMSIEITSIEPGTSGAPLISQNGIVGLIFEDAASGAKAYTIAKVRRLINETWNYPWQMNLNTIKTNNGKRGGTPVPIDLAWDEINNEKKERRKIPLLEAYVSKGQGIHTEDAKKLYEGFLWANIGRAKYIEKYVQHFPEGQYIKQVEDKAFRSVLPEYYIELFPNGRYVDQANKKIEASQKQEADVLTAEQQELIEEENELWAKVRDGLDRESPNYSYMGEYFAKYPKGRFINHIEELTWEKALKRGLEKPRFDPSGRNVWVPATRTLSGHWRAKRASDSNYKEGFEKYLQYFPNGRYSTVASKKVRDN